jgi:hypothetical protein
MNQNLAAILVHKKVIISILFFWCDEIRNKYKHIFIFKEGLENLFKCPIITFQSLGFEFKNIFQILTSDFTTCFFNGKINKIPYVSFVYQKTGDPNGQF